MEVTTLRVPEDELEDLQQEADERDLSLSEYLRRVLRNRDTAAIGGEGDGDLEELRSRLDRVECELGLADGADGTDDCRSPDRETPAAGGDRAGAPDRAAPAPDEIEEEPLEGDDAPLPRAVKQAIEEADVVGRGAETTEVRRDAIRHVWRELRDRGEATTQELANAAFDEYGDHPRFGYSASENHYRGYTFWDSCARGVVKELPGVESPPQRGNTWRFGGVGESAENANVEGGSPGSKGGGSGEKTGVYDPTSEFD